jgi:hypothetical protein
VRHHGVQGRSVAHVQVPVVGFGDGNFLRHVMDCLRCFEYVYITQ